MAEGLAKTDRHVMVEAIIEDLETDMRGKLPSIKTPTLVLYAIDPASKQPDPVAYAAMMQETYRAMPNSTLTRIDNSRHFIMYDQPAKLDEAVEPFVK